MKPLRQLSYRAETMVDQQGLMLADPNGFVIGRNSVPANVRLIYALATNSQSGLQQRYLPPHPPGESCSFGMDFSAVIALGVGIASGTLNIYTNVVPPVDVTASWTVGPVTVLGRALYATLSGGVASTDYQLRWAATDTQGNVWPRWGLLLVAATS